MGLLRKEPTTDGSYTSFFIAYRLSTIRNADQVIVLEEGRIVERGAYDTLLAVGRLYADLYNSQLRR